MIYLNTPDSILLPETDFTSQIEDKETNKCKMSTVLSTQATIAVQCILVSTQEY